MERFAEQHAALPTEQRLPQLLEMARREGIEAIDEDRLSEILPPLFEAQQQVAIAAEQLGRAKDRLRADIPSLSSAQIAEQSRSIERLEHALQSHREAVKARVAELLGDERERSEEKIRGAEEELDRQQRLAAEAEQRRRQEALKWESFNEEWSRSLAAGSFAFFVVLCVGLTDQDDTLAIIISVIFATAAGFLFASTVRWLGANNNL